MKKSFNILGAVWCELKGAKKHTHTKITAKRRGVAAFSQWHSFLGFFYNNTRLRCLTTEEEGEREGEARAPRKRHTLLILKK